MSERVPAVEAIARFVEEYGERVYPRDVFLPVPDEAKAKDAVAADLLRDMLPRVAAAIRLEFAHRASVAAAAEPPLYLYCDDRSCHHRRYPHEHAAAQPAPEPKCSCDKTTRRWAGQPSQRGQHHGKHCPMYDDNADRPRAAQPAPEPK